jgi:hypothetical protein
VTARSLAVALLVLFAACESKGATRVETYGPSQLPCASGDASAWESAPLPDLSGEVAAGCDWVSYPGRTMVEIVHDLGRAPTDVVVYTSFAPSGESSTIASGDSGRIVGADDARVVVENTTEQNFYLRIVVR